MLVKSSRMMNSPASRKTDHSLEQRQFTKKPSKRPQVLMQTPTSPLASSIQSPKHSAVFAQSAARELVARGLPTNAIFQGTGFAADLLDEEMPVADFSVSVAFLEHAAALSKDDLFGHRVGQGQDARSVGLMYYACLTAPTLAEGISRSQRYARLFNSLLDFNASTIREDGRLTWGYQMSPSLPRRQYVELAAAVKFKALRYFVQDSVRLQQIQFQHPRRRNIAPIEGYYGCEVVFGARENAMVFDPADMDTPLRTSDKQLSKVLRLYGDHALSQGRQDAPALVLEVERIIAERLSDGQTTLESVAQFLGMSARTLSRKLSQDGTSFFRILEDLRKAHAKLYLRDSDMVLAEIAFLLGYSGLSSFNDAFKRWTGMSPGQYRSRASKPGLT